MSYCRWSECDVYAYDSCEGGVQFYVAGNKSLDRLCSTYNEAYQYAKELHDVHKLDVPRHALYALMEDAVEEAKRFTGPNSAISELTAENANLREALKALMMGTNAELCADRDEADCTMCSMHHGKDGCTVVDAMELLGIDMYGMPLGVGVDG